MREPPPRHHRETAMSYEDELAALRQRNDALEGLPLARKFDPETSQAAADRIQEQLNALQQRVYAVFLMRGRLTAKQAEKLECFKDLGFSTVRKRVSELAAADFLVADGTIDGSTAYRAVVPGVCG